MAGIIRTAGTFTIADAGTISDAIDLQEMTLVALIIPASFTGTAISFQASDSIAGTYIAVKGTDGTSISYTVASSTYVQIQPAVLAGVRYVKIVSGTAESGAKAVIAMARHCE